MRLTFDTKLSRASDILILYAKFHAKMHADGNRDNFSAIG